ncbi:MAG: hypothetical protein E7191_05070 [Erysipelotrichaceae bacterium]|nr:hypothetical protein [Erysipelotrichaceae bacterium]
MRKLWIICLLLLTACSSTNTPNTDINEGKTTQPTVTDDVRADFITEEMLEKIKEHVIESHIYDEYMMAGGFPEVQVYNTPYGNAKEEYIHVQAQVMDSPTLCVRIGNEVENDGTYDIVVQLYRIRSPITYQRYSDIGEGNIGFYKSVENGEILYSLIARGETYTIKYDEKTDSLINTITGNEFVFLDDLHEKLLKIYKYHIQLFEQKTKNEKLLAENIMRIVNGEEPIMNYDVTPLGFGEYMQSIRNNP